MSFVLSALTFLLVIVVFNLMIIVHELGHFLAAKWQGLVIEEFGVWFGKAIWRKKIGSVWYSLGTIPFGGFVKLPQMAAMDTVEGESETPKEQLPAAKPMSKIIVAVAGPLFSFLLAVFFAVIVYFVGRPVTESEQTTVIGAVSPGSPAADAGLMAGDKILSIDGYAVTHFEGMGKDGIKWRIITSEGETIDMRVQRGSEIIPAYPKPLIPATSFWRRKALRQIGIEPAETPLIAKVDENGAAAAAGMMPGDLLKSLNGKRIYSLTGVANGLGEAEGKPLVFGVQRGAETLELKPMIVRDCVVSEVVKGGAADRAGVLPEDKIVGVNGVPIASSTKLVEAIHANGAKPLSLDLIRAEKPLHLTMTPVETGPEKVPQIGVGPADDLGVKFDGRGLTTLTHPNPIQQINKAAMSIIETIQTISSRKSHVGIGQMGGAVMMIRTYYVLFQIKDGWRLALWFSVILNVNLAILNMLPIPPLDGSHITLSIIEGIRRRPVNVRFVEIIQTACTVAIIGFMIFIFFFDVQDLEIFGGGRAVSNGGHSSPATPPPATPAPAPSTLSKAIDPR